MKRRHKITSTERLADGSELFHLDCGHIQQVRIVGPGDWECSSCPPIPDPPEPPNLLQRIAAWWNAFWPQDFLRLATDPKPNEDGSTTYTLSCGHTATRPGPPPDPKYFYSYETRCERCAENAAPNLFQRIAAWWKRLGEIGQ